MGVFSTVNAAQTWVDQFDGNEFDGCVFIPYIVDEPDYGNVPAEARN